MIGIGIALSQAASRTIVVELVPNEQLAPAIALGSIVFNMSALIGPAIAGLIMVVLDIVACFWVITAMFAINLVAYLCVVRRITGPGQSAGEPMLRAISWVAAPCSSTAAEIAEEASLTMPIVLVMPLIDCTEPCVAL